MTASGVVVLSATGLGQTAAAEVPQRQEHDVEHRLVRTEVVSVAARSADRNRGDDNRYDGRDVRDQLCGLEGHLGLGGLTVRPLDLGAIGTLVWPDPVDGRGTDGSVKAHGISSIENAVFRSD